MRKKKYSFFSNGRRERKKQFHLLNALCILFFVVEILTLIYVAKRVIEQPRFERPSKEITSFFFLPYPVGIFSKNLVFSGFCFDTPQGSFSKKKNGSLVLMYLTRLWKIDQILFFLFFLMVGFDSIILFFQKKRASLFRPQGRKEIKSIFYSTSATWDAFKKLRFESVKLQQKKYSRLESINSSREFQKYTRSVCVCVNVCGDGKLFVGLSSGQRHSNQRDGIFLLSNFCCCCCQNVFSGNDIYVNGEIDP